MIIFRPCIGLSRLNGLVIFPCFLMTRLFAPFCWPIYVESRLQKICSSDVYYNGCSICNVIDKRSFIHICSVKSLLLFLYV